MDRRLIIKDLNNLTVSKMSMYINLLYFMKYRVDRQVVQFNLLSYL